VAEFSCATTLSRRLRDDGWLSPDSYSREFSEAEAAPAVYLFALYGDEDLRSALVAYVGMSINLQQRWNGHDVLALVRQAGPFVKRWFRPTESALLRAVEADLITKYTPPWNTLGKPRGMIGRG